MAEQSLGTLIARERRRLDKKRQVLMDRRGKLDAELAEVEREMAAVQAYESAKGLPRGGRRKKAAARAGTGRRGSRRQAVVDFIGQQADGATRAEILVGLGVKGDKPAEQSVSNALTALKKAGQLVAVDGRYRTAG